MEWFFWDASPYEETDGMHCISVNEPEESSYWDDNILCTDKDYGLVWSHNGPLADKHCVKFYEGSDLEDGWDNNYLCSDIDFGFKWSFWGPIVGMNCVMILEPSDYHGTWRDNFLCRPFP
jgi:hypothetical protein